MVDMEHEDAGGHGVERAVGERTGSGTPPTMHRVTPR
jgi:hypothetical protein